MEPKNDYVTLIFASWSSAVEAAPIGLRILAKGAKIAEEASKGHVATLSVPSTAAHKVANPPAPVQEFKSPASGIAHLLTADATPKGKKLASVEVVVGEKAHEGVYFPSWALCDGLPAGDWPRGVVVYKGQYYSPIKFESDVGELPNSRKWRTSIKVKGTRQCLKDWLLKKEEAFAKKKGLAAPSPPPSSVSSRRSGLLPLSPKPTKSRPAGLSKMC